MKLMEPEKIDEHEFNDFVKEFRSANEKLVPYALDQRCMDFATYIRMRSDESLGKGIP